MTLTWEEAKQKVAESNGFKDWLYMKNRISSPDIMACMDLATELYQESNLERIKELEGYQLKCNMTLSSKQVECDKLKARIKELEDGLKSMDEYSKQIPIDFLDWIAKESFVESGRLWVSDSIKWSGCVYSTEQIYYQFLKENSF